MKKKCAALQATAVILAAVFDSSAETNPIIKDAFTADPAAMVYEDTVAMAVYGARPADEEPNN